jgi:hypothetical protein
MLVNGSRSLSMVVLSVVGAATLSACVKEGELPRLNLSTVLGNDPAKGEYNLFYDQGDHMTDLVDAGKTAEASKLYDSHQSYFVARKEKFGPVVSKLGARLNEQQRPSIDAAVARLRKVRWPLDPAQWPQVEASIDTASLALKQYDAHGLLKDPEHRLRGADVLSDGLARLAARIRGDAVTNFIRYDHTQEGTFVDVYPIDVNAKDLVAASMDRLVPVLQQATHAGVLRFTVTYDKLGALDPAGRQALIEAVYAAAAREEGGHLGLGKTLELASKLKDGGLPDLGRVSFFDAVGEKGTSLVAIDVPGVQPIENLENALAQPQGTGPAFIIVLERVQVSTNSIESPPETASSTYVARTRMVPNEARIAAEERLEGLRAQFQFESARAAGNPFAAPILMAFRANLQNQERGVRSMPREIAEPVREDYKYQVIPLKVNKTSELSIAVLDRVTKDARRVKITIDDVRDFKLVNGIHEKDPNRNVLVSSGDSQSAIAEWAGKPSEIKLSAILARTSQTVALRR